VHTDGFALIENACDQDLVASVLSVARRRAETVFQALSDRGVEAADVGIGSAAGYDEIVQRSPGRWDVPIALGELPVELRTNEDAPWWPLVVSLLGDDAEHSFSGVVFSEPGSPAQQWHSDSPHTAADHQDAHALNILVALEDVSMDMGPTECARGSHVLTNHLANPALVLDELLYQHDTTTRQTVVEGTPHTLPEAWSRPMPAGSGLLFDDRLLHRGMANRSASVRNVAYFCYRRAGYDENTHFESSRSVFSC
jgi:ectoine hydroxylase-related dioxygenase (phytanoyl-CoA dioxygenase family)